MPTTEASSFTPEQQAELLHWFPAQLAKHMVYGGDTKWRRELEREVRELAREEARELLKSAMAASLADPNVSRVAKSLAGYVLSWLEHEEKG